MKFLSQVEPELLKGKKVLVRLDLNVPLTEDVSGSPLLAGEGLGVRFEDADRIRKSMPTLEFLKNAGAQIIIISHIGRDPKESLRPVADYMNIPLVTEVSDDQPIVMLENLRSNPGEEANDEAFAKELASYADMYVNDAFAVSHRAHASLVGVPKFLPSYAGFQMEQEMSHLSQAFNPESPSILILGGAKFETKLPVIEKFLPIVDRIIVGGALANNFYKEQGYEVGLSLVDKDATIQHVVSNPKIAVSQKVVVENERGREEKIISDVVASDKIVDSAPEGLAVFEDEFRAAKFVLWNGPMGNYENGFVDGTKKIVELISTGQSVSIVGGGDSVTLIEELKMENKFTFLSTGGGAMLEYLANGTLPGIEALESNS
jgi:phosphoglycerate kinase